MEDLNDKVTSDELTAAEFVQPMSEIQNIIEQSGQTLTSADVAQMQKALSYFVAGGGYFNAVYDGSGDITLTTPSGFSVLFALSDGMRIRFYAAAAAVVTGGPDLTIGAFTKPLRARDGGTLPTGAVGAGVYVDAQYDLAADQWRTLDASSGNLGQVVLATASDLQETSLIAGRQNRALSIEAVKATKQQRLVTSDFVLTAPGLGNTPATYTITPLTFPLSGAASGTGHYHWVRYELLTNGVGPTTAQPVRLFLDFGSLTEALPDAIIRTKMTYVGAGTLPTTDAAANTLYRGMRTNSVGANPEIVTIYQEDTGDGVPGGLRRWSIDVLTKSTGLNLELKIQNGNEVQDGFILPGSRVTAEVNT